MLLGMQSVFKHQDFDMFGWSQIKQINPLKLWVAGARHNFKWAKIQIK